MTLNEFETKLEEYKKTNPNTRDKQLYIQIADIKVAVGLTFILEDDNSARIIFHPLKR